jgi:hypothetical protein
MTSHSTNIYLKHLIILTQHAFNFFKQIVEGKSSSFHQNSLRLETLMLKVETTPLYISSLFSKSTWRYSLKFVILEPKESELVANSQVSRIKYIIFWMLSPTYFLMETNKIDVPFNLELNYGLYCMLEDWLLSLMSTLVMGFGPQD